MKKLVGLLAALMVIGSARADEGMWMLPYLAKMNIADMQAKGLKLSAEDIYNPKGGSLKDAIVIFGGGCTGEIVSPNGLIFTNHHCGYSYIQALSSLEHDYLKNGFWSMSYQEEIPAPGLSVTFTREIIDVTADVLGNVPDLAKGEEFDRMVSENAQKVQKKLAKKHKNMSVSVQSFFGGNQYFAIVQETYRDVRFVGAPPSSIGKFGGDTDNWMWPRHTGDFSIFRVYADKDGKPAAYSPNNVPLETPNHLAVSTQGYKEGDFAMIMGHPGSTTRFMTSFEIEQTVSSENPTRIQMRTAYLDVLKPRMEASDEVRIKYAAKQSSQSNYWKNAIGMNEALAKLDVKGQKEAQEAAFAAWVSADPMREQKYGDVLSTMKRVVEGRTVAEQKSLTYSEFQRCMDIFTLYSRTSRLRGTETPTAEQIAQVQQTLASAYEDYDESVDRELAVAALTEFGKMLADEDLPAFYLNDIKGRFNGDIEAYVDWLYDNSVLANKESADAFFANFDKEKLQAEPVVKMIADMNAKTPAFRSEAAQYAADYDDAHRLYIAGLMEMEPDAMHYPDANFTLRLTYGNIHPYSPKDAVVYNYFTTLEGVMEKEDPSNPLEFTVPDRLKELYNAKDYGRWADEDGTLHVGFLSNNDITGGNSGSPVLNDKGELIGLAFDGNWEALSGDIAFEHNLQRCINVDVRYVLFCIEKYGNCSRLINELTLR